MARSGIGFEIVGYRDVLQNMYDLANILGDARTYEMLWDVGVEMRKQCQLMCTQVVYSTPESKNYRRTGYLRAAMYVAHRHKNDYQEVRAAAAALPRAVYSRRNLSKTYRMVTFRPENTYRSVRVTSAAIYSQFVEYGGSVGPRPFMRAGMAAGQARCMRVAQDAFSRMNRDLSAGRYRMQYVDPVTKRFAKRPI